VAKEEYFSFQDVMIEDTFAEMFPMLVSRILITAENKKWAMTSASLVTGFAVSIIMSPAEAGIERTVPASETPDGRPGVAVQLYHHRGYLLKGQLLTRIGQCVMTCPTTAAFDLLEDAKKHLQIGKSLSIFGDGFQTKDKLADRVVYRIPVMEGEFMIQESFGVKRGIAGGNFIILSKDQKSGLAAAEASVDAIRKGTIGAVLTFPGGICRSGSKVGSLKYKLPASTNHLFCPTIKGQVPDTKIVKGVGSAYEIVINGLDLESIKKAMKDGITAACNVKGVLRVTAANYRGKLGPYQAHLKDILTG
jgi:formylmethanofuran--tetrahydromethanopterin N-formyltransferase